MAIVVLANYGINIRLIVPGNAAETARNIMAHETLFRINIACNLIYVVTVVALLAALYVILKPVNRNLALVAALCRLLLALMWCVTALNTLGALRLVASQRGQMVLHVRGRMEYVRHGRRLPRLSSPVD
jgi:hypothetical protein